MTNLEKTETWFIEQLEQDPVPMADILKALTELAREKHQDKAIDWAEQVYVVLLAQERFDDLLALLQLRARWSPDTDFRAYCKEVLSSLFGTNQDGRCWIKNAGFDQRISTEECLRRFTVLRALRPGVLCSDKTWGFGVVKNVDTYYERIAIDFDRKRDHELALAYAAETLELLDDEHLLARKHKDPNGIAALIKDDPAEVVRLALRSYGPMNAIILQEQLSPTLVPAAKWKGFWDAARRGLKEDPLVVLPSKRTELIVLRAKEKAMDEGWFRALAKNRRLESILDHIQEWLDNNPEAELTAEQRAIVVDRLAFVVKGASLMDRKLKAMAMMLAQRILPNDPDLNPRGYVESVLDSKRFVEILAELPAKDTKEFFVFLIEMDRDKALDTLLEALPRLDGATLNEAIAVLLREDREEGVRDIFRSLIAAREAEVELVSWLCRNMERVKQWSLCLSVEFATIVLLEMEKSYNGARLRAQNQVKERFANREWIKGLWSQMQDEERKRFFLRVKESTAWQAMEKRSALGQIIKAYPELEVLMTPKTDGQASKPRGSVTSHRSYRERHQQLVKIKTVDIPQNSKDIGHARSFGDLRENFEYQSAKEMQGILMRRQAEVEQMIEQTVPTDFDTPPTDKVGMGAGVTIEHPDGRQETFYILGAWDRDEALGIVSCESKLAQALDGQTVGATVTIPGEHGETTCRVTAILPLSEPVRAWLAEEG